MYVRGACVWGMCVKVCVTVMGIVGLCTVKKVYLSLSFFCRMFKVSGDVKVSGME